jgi:hypothetical protein
MAYFEQRITYVFPAWARMRKDPSSFGNIFLTAYAGLSTKNGSDAVKISEMLKVLQEDTSNGNLYEVDLDGDDQIEIITMNGRRIFKIPKVTGEIDGIKIPLLRATSIEDFLYSVPSRIVKKDKIQVTKKEVWSSSDPEYFEDDYIVSERLLVRVFNSDSYKRKNSQTKEDLPFYGLHYVRLQGYDDELNEVNEIISVRDDGWYRTRNIFKKLELVEWDGFDGDIEIYLCNGYEGLADFGRILSKWETGNTNNLSGPLAFYLENTDSIAHLRSTSVRYLKGHQYRRLDVLDLEEEIEEDLAIQRLLDDDANTFLGVGMAVNPVDSRVFILDSSGRVHLYEPSLTDFSNSGTPPSDDTYMDIISLKDRVILNETIPLWTWFRALVLPVQKVSIKRAKPDGTEEYLQDDLSWSAPYHYFSGNILPPEGGFPENTWEDFKFYTEFDQLGQWNFYCETKMLGLETVQVTSRTAVMCESLQAVKSYDVLPEAIEGEDIFFDKENFLCISAGDSYHRYDLKSDVFISDFNKQKLLLKEHYDSVEVQHE